MLYITIAMGWELVAFSQTYFKTIKHHSKEGYMGKQASLELDLTFGDVLLHKLIQAY